MLTKPDYYFMKFVLNVTQISGSIHKYSTLLLYLVPNGNAYVEIIIDMNVMGTAVFMLFVDIDLMGWVCHAFCLFLEVNFEIVHTIGRER